MKALVQCDRAQLALDLSRPVSLAIELDFAGAQPRHFGAPAATQRAFAVPGFSGSVVQGASCNCSIVTLIPHCNGTHTECVGHLTSEPLDAHRVVPPGPITAALVSVTPVAAAQSVETTQPPPQSGDQLITRASLDNSWPASLPFNAQALVVRTLPNEPEKASRDYSRITAPYFSAEALQMLVDRGIEHLVVDLPSIDRSRDGGHLTGHRIFFGLTPGSKTLSEARRAAATITELAFIPDTLRDGAYLLQIQVPALGGDAVPSRPVLFELELQ